MIKNQGLAEYITPQYLGIHEKGKEDVVLTS